LPDVGDAFDAEGRVPLQRRQVANDDRSVGPVGGELTGGADDDLPVGLDRQAGFLELVRLAERGDHAAGVLAVGTEAPQGVLLALVLVVVDVAQDDGAAAGGDGYS
jgi:hypothetical protein